MSAEYFYDLDQNTPEWLQTRAGIPTASEFHKVLAQGQKKGEASKTRRQYMLTLIAERITGQPSPPAWAGNAHSRRGHEYEEDARNLYAFMTDNEPLSCGFIRNGNTGCSPDGLIDANGMMQIKTRLPYLQLELLLSGEVPKTHTAQLQGELWVAEREWTDFVSYWPGLDLFVKRVHRDETLIKSIELGVTMFLNEMHELMAKLQRKAA